MQEIFLSVIKEESEKTRALTRGQHDTQVAKAKEAGVEFHQLSQEEIDVLKQQAEPVIQEWSKKIGPDYLAMVQAALK